MVSPASTIHVAAARMVGKAQALVGAGADVDHAEDRRPGRTALGDDGIDDRAPGSL